MKLKINYRLCNSIWTLKNSHTQDIYRRENKLKQTAKPTQTQPMNTSTKTPTNHRPKTAHHKTPISSPNTTQRPPQPRNCRQQTPTLKRTHTHHPHTRQPAAFRPLHHQQPLGYVGHTPEEHVREFGASGRWIPPTTTPATTPLRLHPLFFAGVLVSSRGRVCVRLWRTRTTTSPSACPRDIHTRWGYVLQSPVCTHGRKKAECFKWQDRGLSWCYTALLFWFCDFVRANCWMLHAFEWLEYNWCNEMFQIFISGWECIKFYYDDNVSLSNIFCIALMHEA